MNSIFINNILTEYIKLRPNEITENYKNFADFCAIYPFFLENFINNFRIFRKQDILQLLNN